jgi:hypothetical protein
VAAVLNDLNRLAAIDRWRQAAAQTAGVQHSVDDANAQLRKLEADAVDAGTNVNQAKARVATISDQLSRIALAAYTGGTGPDGSMDAGTGQGLLAGTLGTGQLDAFEMLGVAVTQERSDLASGKKAVKAAQHQLDLAQEKVRHQRTVVAAAQTALDASTAQLNTLVRTAISSSPPDGSPPSSSTSGTAPPSSAPPTTPAGRSGQKSRAPAYDGPPSPTILGPSILDAPDLAAWFASTGHQVNTTVPLGQLTQDYLNAGATTGVRADIAFAQSIVETGWFSFPAGGQLNPSDNNFAGIGACDSCAHGWSFPDAATGVLAQLQLLEAYASPKKVPTPLVGPVGVGGCCQTWIALAGTWATSTTYGVAIMTVYRRMLDWLIPHRLAAAGLKPASA